MRRARSIVAYPTGETHRLQVLDGMKYLSDLQSLGVSKERMYLVRLNSSVLRN